MPEYTNIGVEEDAKELFRQYKRRLEAARDEDMTDSEAMIYLVENAPDPLVSEGIREGEDDEE